MDQKDFKTTEDMKKEDAPLEPANSFKPLGRLLSVDNGGNDTDNQLDPSIPKYFQTAVNSTKANVKEKDELLQNIKKMMLEFDANGDGILEPEEIVRMHEVLEETQSQTKYWKNIIIVLFVALFFSVCANLGSAYLANKLYQQLKVHGSSTMTSTTSNEVVSTSTATVNVPLGLLPIAGIKIVDQLQHIRFTAVDVTLTSGPITGYYPSLQMGMNINSYQYFNETSMDLIGAGSEVISIHMGHVSLSGFEGVEYNATVEVCPGLEDPSHARCSLLKLTDVNLDYIIDRARALGILSSSGRRRLGRTRYPTRSPGTAPYTPSITPISCPAPTA